MVKVRIFNIHTFSHIYYYIFKSIVFVFSGDKQDYKKNIRIKAHGWHRTLIHKDGYVKKEQVKLIKAVQAITVEEKEQRQEV